MERPRAVYVRDTRGRFRLLEVNRSPMFLGFETRGGGDVLGALAHAR